MKEMCTAESRPPGRWPRWQGRSLVMGGSKDREVLTREDRERGQTVGNGRTQSQGAKTRKIGIMEIGRVMPAGR